VELQKQSLGAVIQYMYRHVLCNACGKKQRGYKNKKTKMNVKEKEPNK